MRRASSLLPRRAALALNPAAHARRFAAAAARGEAARRAAHVDDAIGIVRAYASARFDASVDISLVLNSDYKRTDERVKLMGDVLSGVEVRRAAAGSHCRLAAAPSLLKMAAPHTAMLAGAQGERLGGCAWAACEGAATA